MRFSVNKLAPALVAPSEPTPSGNLPLSSIDRTTAVSVTIDLILVFEHGEEPAKVIREALSKALVPYYPVAGRIVEPSPGEPEVACTGDGVWFVEASANFGLKDVNNLERPLMIPKEELLPCAPPDVNPGDAILMMQAEFVACYGATVQAIWLRNFISELKVVDSISRPITIYYDNSAAVFFSKNNKSSGGSKHIDI
ncbi:myricetin 3-O-glucosyl 1,2-rhamnoside 6'-O-caffeoyltransferase AT2-like [Phoenix dactylifera]|uniref:Myricetin 3-O-glucosyl 1,2-rhamnoside 6'-O-caffeoyltransferase AT2-like n=1 Tax=Phoenix dactylifera TaxID=42345 RepID=A0A8B8J000_PHODC|nr:myricetin 3-O-glucosyl 1,2-rhamnoside 6'-O-caffeoyltransferase AT2-like [Phoenix dactylifera]